MSNAATVQAIYQAFGEGNVPAILEHLAEDVEWDVWDAPSESQDAIPFLKARRGHTEVSEFFGLIADTFEFHGFEPAEFYESQQGGVAVRINLDLEVKANGNRYQDTEIHLWTFNDDGSVAAFRHQLDTRKHADALA